VLVRIGGPLVLVADQAVSRAGDEFGADGESNQP
jgi:hypothetical protein